MAGQALTRGCARRLDSYGEEAIFDLYIKHKSVRKLLKNMPEEVGNMSNAPFYKWLKADPERRDKWQMCKAIIASSLAEEALQIVDECDDGSVQSARLRAEQRRWMAERYDRTSFGRNPIVNVGVVTTFADDYMTALMNVEEERKKESEDQEEISGEYEVIAE